MRHICAEEIMIDDFNMGEGVCFSNITDTEWLFLRRENGGFENQYNYFYLLSTIPNTKGKSIIRLSDSIFTTTQGIHLGSRMEEFEAKYKKIPFKVKQENDRRFYSFSDSINQYTCTYIFEKGRLYQIEFGYVW